MNVRVEVLPRPTGGDEELGAALVDLVTRAVIRGGAPPAGVAGRGDRVDLVGLQGIPHIPRFLGALTRSTRADLGSVDVVGLLGALPTVGRGGEAGPPVAVVFLEWPDCRWWYWRALLGADRKVLLPETATWSRAHDGDRMPPQLGRWWTLGRRAGLSLAFRPAEPIVH